MIRVEHNGIFGSIARFTQPDKYICNSLADFLDNRDKILPTDRHGFSLAAAFNGFSLVSIQEKLTTLNHNTSLLIKIV